MSAADIQAARDAAIEAMRRAKDIVEVYRDPHGWRLDWQTKNHRAQNFGLFIRAVEAAATALKGIDALLPPPDKPVRYGNIVAGTAHAVAVKFGRSVMGEFNTAFNDAHPDDDSAAACDLYNRAMSGDVDAEYLHESQGHMQELLKQVAIIDTEELFFAIDNESKRTLENLRRLEAELAAGETSMIEFSAAIESPQDWAGWFGWGKNAKGSREFMNRVKDGSIRAKKISTRRYRVAIDDLPAKHSEANSRGNHMN